MDHRVNPHEGIRELAVCDVRYFDDFEPGISAVEFLQGVDLPCACCCPDAVTGFQQLVYDMRREET